MRAETHAESLDLLRTEGRILESVADGRVLHGTMHELAAQLRVDVADVGTALSELQRVGWVVAYVERPGRLAVRLERRTGPRQVPPMVERRHSRPAVWRHPDMAH